MNLSIQIKKESEAAIQEMKAKRKLGDWSIRQDRGSDPMVLLSHGDTTDPTMASQIPQEGIERIVLTDQISRGIRLDGIYIRGDNRITVCSFPGGQNFRGTGTTVAGLQELYRLIRTGQMQPTENWEAPIQSAPVTVTRI